MLLADVAQAQSPDVAFGHQVAIIRAHVATGDELVQKRDWGLAYRHFMFPLEEVYGVIRVDLRSYKTPPFDRALRTLAHTAKARNAKQYPRALQQVQTSLAGADANLKTRQPDWSSFVLRVAVAVLKKAPEEYDDAVEQGRVIRPISYQVARGHILEAERMIEGVGSELAAKNPQAVREIRDNLAQLKASFTALNAPRQDPPDLAAVTERVGKVEAAAAKF